MVIDALGTYTEQCTMYDVFSHTKTMCLGIKSRGVSHFIPEMRMSYYKQQRESHRLNHDRFGSGLVLWE